MNNIKRSFFFLADMIHRLTTCRRCHGMGYVELPNGDTIECRACGGKGYV